MKIISHRGNINGVYKKKENKVDQIEKALTKFDCEIDIWFWKKNIYLGHDKPESKIDIKFLFKHTNKLWIHAKNKEIIKVISKTNLNWFWHENDKMTLTSKNVIWAYPNNYFYNGITVIENIEIKFPRYIMGICTDNPCFFEKKYEQ